MSKVIQKSIGLPPSQWKKLAKLAKDDRRALAAYIRDALRQHVERVAG